MRIVFYSAPPLVHGHRHRNAFTADNLEAGIGGSQSALICMAKSLAALGNHVEIYNYTDKERYFDGVLYCPVGRFDSKQHIDVFFLFRYFSPIINEVVSNLKILWSHDIPSDKPLYGIPKSLVTVDRVFAVSPFHGKSLTSFAKEFGISHLEEKVWVTSNGIVADDYRINLPKKRNQVIYCSVPDRGLSTILHVWPRIKSSISDAQLIITGDYSLWGHPPGTEEFKSRAQQLQGVTFLGRVPRSELIRHQLESEVHVLPGGVPENFCIASIECQASGTPTVAVALGALPTTVVDGYSGLLVAGEPGTEPFDTNFAETVIRLLQDRPMLQRLSGYGRERALTHFAYDKLARIWQEELAGLLEIK